LVPERARFDEGGREVETFTAAVVRAFVAEIGTLLS